MTGPDDPEFPGALNEASERLQRLHAELLDAHPSMRGNLSIPGMLVGYGLGSFVASGLTDEQIVAHVMGMIGNIRQTFGAVVKDVLPDDEKDDEKDVEEVAEEAPPEDVSVH